MRCWLDGGERNGMAGGGDRAEFGVLAVVTVAGGGLGL